jgi:hypothetical protein
MRYRVAAIACFSLTCLIAWPGNQAVAADPFVEYEAACKADIEDDGKAEVVCACMVRNLKTKDISETEIGALLQAKDGTPPTEELEALADFEAQLAELCVSNPEMAVTAD